MESLNIFKPSNTYVVVYEGFKCLFPECQMWQVIESICTESPKSYSISL